MSKNLLEPFRITNGRKFRLADVRPDDTRGLKSKDEARKALEKGIRHLADLQEKLYAQDQWGVLLIFQAMDAAGKDGAIAHVMSGVNPQGCQVFSFKAPSTEEIDHDFLWRTTRCLPERGRIGIFNRSYYEEVLIVRVHPQILGGQKVPAPLVTKDIWEQRFEDITAFERYLSRQGYLILKFFLHVSKDEQKQRFLTRLEEPEKHWKFSVSDVKEREHWKQYMAAYEDAIRHTAAAHAPWYVVPADRKWFSRLVIAAAVYDALSELDLRFPTVDAGKAHELASARAQLQGSDAPAAAVRGGGDAKKKGGKKKDKKAQKGDGKAAKKGKKNKKSKKDGKAKGGKKAAADTGSPAPAAAPARS
jgi:PPK2 family polyphosphate:nucleotide phosphotransferase